MSSELPPVRDDELPPDPATRRALIIYYDDQTNEVELYSDEFGPLEVPELLRVALDLAEESLPSPLYADDTDETE